MPTSTIISYVIVLVVLLFLSGLFSGLETASTSASLIRLRSMKLRKELQRKKLKIVINLLRYKYNSLLTSLLIGNNVINILIATIASLLFVGVLNSESTGAIVSTIVTSVLVLIVAEIIPKNFAKLYPEQVCISLAYILYCWNIILLPFTKVFSLIKLKITKPLLTEDELVQVVGAISNEGVLERNERDLVQAAILFDETKVKTLMVNNNNVKTLFSDMTIGEFLSKSRNYIHTRTPILDRNTGNIVGILNVKDILSNYDNLSQKVSKIARRAQFISQNIYLDKAFEIMQKSHTPFAIVSSTVNKKDFVGIVTSKDITQMLTGINLDEHNYIVEKAIQKTGRKTWQATGSVTLHNLFENNLNCPSPTNDEDLTLSTWFSTEKNNIESNILDPKLENIIYYNRFKISLITKKKQLKAAEKRFEITDVGFSTTV